MTTGSTLGLEFDVSEYQPEPLFWEEIFSLGFTQSQPELTASQSYFDSIEANATQSEQPTFTTTNVKIEDEEKSDDTPPTPESESEYDLPVQNQRKRQRASASQTPHIETAEERILALQHEIADLKNESKAVRENTELTQKAKRLELNRISAKLSRRNKELSELQSKVHLINLEQENAALKEENATLKALLAEMLQNTQQNTSVSVTIPETTLLFHYQASSSPKTSPVKKQECNSKPSRPNI